ncbi:MAG: hypothetical protein CTY12_00095 [Methylotenera sp.]|nr:MAG: hypothetical protein CTY12_00095 [Methylotenera sp.]
MDPRNFTVKPCPAAYSAKSSASIGSAVSNRRDFFNSVGKIGDLQVLNSVGAGAIGQGLRTLASASNSIRTGCGSLPSVIGDSIDQGANWVLDNMGISPTVIDSLRGLNPSIANHAWGQAKNIYENIQKGHFKATDIPSYLQDFQNLERLARGIYTPGDDRLNSLSPACEASPYAIDLIARAPKYKFLFVVQFVTARGFESLNDTLRGMAFVVKKSSRPKITYQSEDVNHYNFRSSVITKAKFEDMTMSFHDDILNNTTDFYTAYMRAMSPITNLSPSEAPTHDSLQELGMQFEGRTLSKDGVASNYAASLGIQPEENKQCVFKEIILYHVFDNGNRITAYHFITPRITQLDPDDVDMSVGNEGNELSLTFSYDNIYVETKHISEFNENLLGAQSDAFYQLKYNDSPSKMGPSSNGINPFGTPIGGSSTCDPLGSQDTRGGAGSLAVGGGFGGAIGQGLGDFITI